MLPIPTPRIPSTRAIEPIATSQSSSRKEMVSMSPGPGKFCFIFEKFFFYGLTITSFSGWSNSWMSSLKFDIFLCLKTRDSESFEDVIGEKSDFWIRELFDESCCD